MSEILPLVNKCDVLIRQAERDDLYKDSFFHEHGITSDQLAIRVINAFIRRSDGRLWVPRRASTKRLFPSCLDVSVGGHVTGTDEYEQTLIRETEEELNLILNKDEYREVGYFNPWQHGVHAYQKVYEILSDEAPEYNKNDFSEYFWLTPDELIEKLAHGDAGKGDLLPLVLLVYKK